VSADLYILFGSTENTGPENEGQMRPNRSKTERHEGPNFHGRKM